MHKLKSTEIVCCLLSLAAGVLLHFVYDWSGQSMFAAWIAPVNESPWEHLKMLFYPMLLFTIIEYYLLDRPDTDYWNIKTYAIALGMLMIAAGFYTYSGILGFTLVPADIAVFFGSVILSFRYSYRRLKEETHYTLSNVPFFCLLAAAAAAFAVFTWVPPDLAVFVSLK